MNVFWMLLRGWLLQQQQATEKANKKGQGIVEYSGALVVAGILTVAVISQVNGSMGKWFISLLNAVSKSVQQWL